jgi:predicted P-loop ATPase
VSDIDDLAEARAKLRDKGGAWRAQLLLSATKDPRPLLANALLALHEAPEWGGVLGYDEFALTAMAMRPPPWVRTNGEWPQRAWSDRDDTLTAEWLQRQGIGVTKRVASVVVQAVAQAHSYHPVRDYLTGLKWDGANRLEIFAATYLGAEDTSYHAAVERCLFLAAVARIMQPGCKADHIPILEGEQGTFKSSLLDAIFSPWFSDDLAELGSKDAQMQMAGVWCVEIAELTGMRRADIERVKAFASRRVDRYRPSYGRHVIAPPRQCICIGTTNSERYLKDETGARRFWPVRCGRIDVAAATRDRDQLWAEALSLYQAGEPWWLADSTEVIAARVEQEERYAEDTWTEIIGDYTEGKDEVSVSAILREAIGKPAEQWTQVNQNRVAGCLKAQGGWKRVRLSTRNPRPWGLSPRMSGTPGRIKPS